MTFAADASATISVTSKDEDMMKNNQSAKPNQDEERLALIKALVAEDIAERLRTGEITVVRTDPDGTRWYRKTAKVH